VWIAGLPVAGRHLAEARRRVGLLFQDPDDQLFCPTVLEDVIIGPQNLGLSRQACQEIAGRCLADVGLRGYEDRLPHHLSLGERKRVCLAAILACEPSILALDEPSGNLDPAMRRQFIALLRGLPLTKMIATHDLELVLQLCERVAVLDKGQIVADGPTREVLSNALLLAAHGLEAPLSLRCEMDSGRPSR
jgi:energy-coupling factor transporter ATP-binding protein EcfA2